jgi:energy-coupling factor transporter ATP-binding protein EcfA2
LLIDTIGINGYSLLGLERVNVLFGKNGCGKSYLLRQLEAQLRGQPEYGTIRYITPERGGLPRYDANIEQTVMTNPTWLSDTRRQNQTPQFREQSATHYRKLEIRFLRDLEQSRELRLDTSITFDKTVDRINRLLDRVELQRADPVFQIIDRSSKRSVHPNEISSGEAELISISLECLMFESDCDPSKPNLLLFDEPDVHLHPDLQARLADFITSLCSTSRIPFIAVIATHSTPLLASLAEAGPTTVALMRYGDVRVKFSPVDETYRRILPVFGAHPLSNVFNERPILLLEGDGDVRVWQQAVQSSNGRLRAYPCSVAGVPHLTAFEERAAGILQCVYDNAKGYSIRDGDDTLGDISDIGPICRMRLNCRTIENLIVTNDVIGSRGLTWDDLRSRIVDWCKANASHPHISHMTAFEKGGFNRRVADLKDIRNDLLGLLGTNKPWEVLVGQAIAKAIEQPSNAGPFSVRDFLGPKIVCELLSDTA